MRWMSLFVAVVWCSTFAVCSATRGLVGTVAADIERATAQLGEWSVVGTGVVYFGYAVLAVAALGTYAALWGSWLRHMPAADASGGGAAGREAGLRVAIAAEIRVFIHMALVIFAVVNFAPLGWISLATAGLAAVSVAMAMFVLVRAGRFGGPPHGELWLVAALILATSAATGWYAVAQGERQTTGAAKH